MTTTNRSQIMKRAWELVKKAGNTLSEGLKQAWAEAKGLIKVRPQLIKKKKIMTFAQAVAGITQTMPKVYQQWLAQTATEAVDGGIR